MNDPRKRLKVRFVVDYEANYSGNINDLAKIADEVAQTAADFSKGKIVTNGTVNMHRAKAEYRVVSLTIEDDE